MKSTKLGPIKLLIIQATPFCNIDCDYCYLPDKSSRTKLSLDLIEPIFRNIFLSNFTRQDFTVVWHAGEPLSVPVSFYISAIEIIEKVRSTLQISDYKVSHSIQTNGTLINKKWCDFFKTYNINLEESQEKCKIEKRYIAFIKRFYELTKNSNGKLECREFKHLTNSIYFGKDTMEGQFTPFTIINIDSNGNFSTFSPELLGMKSEIYGDFILGNVLFDNFDEVCNSEKFKRLNQDIQAGVNLCRNTCEYFALCGGGAPSNKYYENGSFISTETMYCRYTKKYLVDIILKDIEASLDIEA